MGWNPSLKSLFGDRIAQTLEITSATTLTTLFVRSDMEAFANIHLDKTIQNAQGAMVQVSINTTNPLKIAFTRKLYFLEDFHIPSLLCLEQDL